MKSLLAVFAGVVLIYMCWIVTIGPEPTPLRYRYTEPVTISDGFYGGRDGVVVSHYTSIAGQHYYGVKLETGELVTTLHETSLKARHIDDTTSD